MELPLRGVKGGLPPLRKGGSGGIPPKSRRAWRNEAERSEARKPADPPARRALASRGRVGGSHLLVSLRFTRKCFFPTHPRVFGGFPRTPFFQGGQAPLDPPQQERETPSCAKLKPMTNHQKICQTLRNQREKLLRHTHNKLLNQKIHGRQAAQTLSTFHDQAITHLFHYATTQRHPSPNPTTSENIALLATGGYGRGMLAPHSDLDLLFLLPYKPTPWSESVIETTLYALWDCGLKVGHAVRRVEECLRMAKTDATIRTALLDARPLEGSADLFSELTTKFRRQAQSRSAQRAFIAAKLAEREKRLRQVGQSRYMVEPDVKNGKGGLRDLQTLLWIANHSYNITAAQDLAREGLLTEEDAARFQKCEDMLWKTRWHLHHLAGRAEERLAFDKQRDMAKAFGIADVERFMKNHFLNSKYVGDLTRIVCAVLEERQKKPRPVLRRLAGVLRRSGLKDRALRGTPFAFSRGRLVIKETPRASALFQDAPMEMMRLFHIAAKKGAPIHPQALSLASRAKDKAAALRDNSEAGRLFLETLTANAAEDALRAMNETGVLGRFIPDFGRIVALMQFNMYHHYTADEHLLRAIGGLADLAEDGEDNEAQTIPPGAKRLLQKIRADKKLSTILAMAVFLHDIAKGRDEDHSEAGAKTAKRLCRRFGMKEEETAIVSWLVRHHLLMSDTAQRRDVSDPQTARDFARKVISQTRLDLLYLLTIVDIRAVGPGVWNGWKAELLERLYESASRLIAGERTAPAAATVRAKRKALRQAAAAARLTLPPAFIPLHRAPYWTMLSTQTHRRHAALFAEFEEKGEPLAFSAHDDERRAVTEICLIAEDHPGLFARAAGAFALAGLSIVDARIFTAKNALAFDSFCVQDAEGHALRDPKRVQRLKNLLMEVMAGSKRPARALAAGPAAAQDTFRVPPLLRLDNAASRQSTILEVEGLDRPGLLYGLAYALFRLGVVISSARIATFGERAVDVFTITDGLGQKITSESRRAEIKSALMKVLKPSPRASPKAKRDPSLESRRPLSAAHG